MTGPPAPWIQHVANSIKMALDALDQPSSASIVIAKRQLHQAARRIERELRRNRTDFQPNREGVTE